MMQNMVHPQEQLPIEEIASPLGAQIFEFCESELFQETLQNSEVASNSNCCYEEHSSYPPHDLSITDDMNQYPTALDNNDIPPPPTTAGPTNLSAVFLEDDLENDITASIDFTPHEHQYLRNNQEVPFDNINQISLGDAADGSLYAPAMVEAALQSVGGPVLGPPPFPIGFEETSVPSYINLGQYFSSGAISTPFSAENSGIFTGGTASFLGSDFSDFQRENGGFFFSDSLARVFNFSSGDLQALSNESQHRMLHGNPSTALTTEISSLEDPTFKVGKLSVEERKRKINKYMKKRNERNFSKKIKYACRKTLADSRPRVRGRFAKNEELGDQINGRISTTNSSGAVPITNNEDHDTDEDLTAFSNHAHHNKVGKGEEDMDSSDIFAHISGVNSLKCNYPIQSWI